MKLSISNIAWDESNDSTVHSYLHANNVTGIEVAPTKYWQNWEGISSQSISDVKMTLAEAGFVVPALQAILFGKPDLQVFNRETHDQFIEHFKMLADIAFGLGAKILVFGAPRNRKRNELSYNDGIEIASELFSKLGDVCKEQDVIIGIENNPVDYGSDFITSVAECKDFIFQLNHSHVKVHLDSAGVNMNSGSIGNTIRATKEFVHYHISEPMLGNFKNAWSGHNEAKAALSEVGYDEWVSIEMRMQENYLESIKEAVEFSNRVYA